VRVGPGDASYLAVRENFNRGWSASLNGHKLTPVKLDGWQQGFILPAGQGGVAVLTFRAGQVYRWLLLLSVVLVSVVIALAFIPGGSSAPSTGSPGPAVLGWLFAAILLALTGGLVVLAVIPLVLVARRWPKALPWVAGGSLLVAGIIAASQGGLGPASQTGAFGGPAQALALIGVGAVLVAAAGPMTGTAQPAEAVSSPGADPGWGSSGDGPGDPGPITTPRRETSQPKVEVGAPADAANPQPDERGG
jgi:arabinofuranan 3-O-arabinosyltransferase